MAFIMMRTLVQEGLIDLRGIVTTLAPSFDRARLCRGTLDLLGLTRVPVGIGTDGGDADGKHTAAEFQATAGSYASSYMPLDTSETAMKLEPGTRLLSRLYLEAEPGSITLLIIASLKDAAIFLRDNEALFVEKTREIVIQGGVREIPTGSRFLEPDTSSNLTFDVAASEFVFRRCQELGVRLVCCSRYAAYEAKMPRCTYDQLANLGSSIGRRLRNAERSSIEQLWSCAAVGPDDPRRKGLPPRCDRFWFINTYCGGRDDPLRTADGSVWDLVDGFMQYDTMALFAAVPPLRERFFSPEAVLVNGIEHLVIGVSKDAPNVVEPRDGLLDYLDRGFRKGIALNHHFKAQVILIGELRQDTLVDICLTCAMLRTLFALGTLHCIGVVTFVDRSDTAFATREPIKVVRDMLDQLGLRFVPLHTAEDALSGAEYLRQMYAKLLPSGVTLINTASLSVLSKFAEIDASQFLEMTARVILMGGATRPEHRGCLLQPDPAAQNNRLDLQVATHFYRVAQEMSVPLVVLSRFATQSGQVPLALFNALESHGGTVGQALCRHQRASLQALWERANAPDGSPLRGNLPSRCDRSWFLATFCRGRGIDDTKDLWDQVTSVTVYSPCALLVALPGVMKRFLAATQIEVRAATHQVIGWSSDDTCVADPIGLQRVIAHYIVYGCRANASEYALPQVPPLPLAGEYLELAMSEDAIQAVIPAHAAVCL